MEHVDRHRCSFVVRMDHPKIFRNIARGFTFFAMSSLEVDLGDAYGSEAESVERQRRSKLLEYYIEAVSTAARGRLSRDQIIARLSPTQLCIQRSNHT